MALTEVQWHKVKEAALTLREGGVIICPTEGVYGISARVSNIKGIERIISIKHRAFNKGLIIVSSSVAQLESVVNFGALSADSMRLIHNKWPGHNTFIVPAKSGVSPVLTGGRTTMAARVTDFELLAALCDEVGEPIVSTSANISGSEPLTTLPELQATFATSIDYILDEPCMGRNKPSTIYDALTGAVLRA